MPLPLSVPRAALLALAAAAALSLGACSDYGDSRPGYNSREEYRQARREQRYREYRMGQNDQIYRDNEGNYYCQRRDGTKGAIVGGLAGGVLGNIIAPNGSKTLGTIIGAAGGALAGQAIDKNGVRCR